MPLIVSFFCSSIQYIPTYLLENRLKAICRYGWAGCYVRFPLNWLDIETLCRSEHYIDSPKEGEMYSLSQRIVLAPHCDELRQVVRAQDGGVARQVVEAIHDDGHHDVQHDEAAQEDKGHEIEVGHVGSAGLVRIHGKASGSVDLVRPLVTMAATDAGHHDVGPGLSRRASEEHHEGLRYGAEVVVPLDGCVRVEVDVAEELHADDGVDEEEHDHEHHDVGQGLDGLDEREQEDPDTD